MFSSRTHWRFEPNPLAQALERHRRSGRPLLDLTASNPTNCGLAYPDKKILHALADPRALAYEPESKGALAARQAVAEYYCGRTGFSGANQEVSPERIVLVSGTSEAYSHIFRLLCEPDDEVLVPAPSYPLFEYLAELNDVHLVPYPLLYDHGWQMDLEALRGNLRARSRAVLLVHPNNPTGSFAKTREANELSIICAAREIAIVADEVFLDYAGREASPSTFALDGPALTFTLSGLSKICLLPQMKLAWMVVSGPEALAQAAMDRLEVIADTYLSPGTPVQLAASQFLALRQTMQEQLQGRIETNLARLDSMLGMKSPVTRLERDGGWYAVLRVPSSRPDEALAVDLLDHCSVLVHPGHFYNFAQNGFLVVSLIGPEAEFQEAIRRVFSFLATLR
jgi:aspartate/methionine/tyrosine aminotransferase